MATTGLYYLLSVKNAEKDNDSLPNPQIVYVRLYDLSLEDDDTTDHTVIELVGSGDPFHTSSVDNSEDKFTGIKPTQATIKFISSDTVNLSNFTRTTIPPNGVDVGDPRWYVEAYLNEYLPENFIFKGFLNLDDCHEDFMPTKNEVTLVANDGLAQLKNIPLTDFSGTNPKGYHRIAEFFAWALSETGLDLELNAIFNIREASLGDDHIFDVIYLHAKTFEEKIGTSINCFDVIERILGEEAYLTQRVGQWWIVRVDELANSTELYNTKYDADGTKQPTDAGKFYDKVIQKETDIFFSQEQTSYSPQRPVKFIKENYKFEYPQEIVDNVDFSRGDLIISLSAPTVTVDGITYYQGKYEIEDWSALVGSSGVPGTGSASTTNNYIRKLFIDSNKTYEASRYVVIEGTSGGGTFFIRSNRIPVHKHDKIDVSVDARYSSDVFSSSGAYRINTMQVRLYGNNGSNYTLHGGTSVEGSLEWRVTSGSFTSNNRFFVIEGNLTEDMTQWKTATWITTSKDQNPCPPIPVDGELEILLIHDQNSSFQTDRYFSNLRFTYIPFINGSYSKYSSYYYKISKDINYINVRDQQVYLGDGFKKLFKGSMFKIGSWTAILASQAAITTTIFGSNLRIVTVVATGDVRTTFKLGEKIRVSGTTNNNGTYTIASLEYNAGNTVIETVETLVTEGGIPTITFERPNYVLAQDFYAWNDINTNDPDDQYIHPYGHIQAYDVWNQFRNGYNKFQATVQGLDGDSVDQNLYIDYPSLIHRWILQDSDETTDDRYFMLLHFDIDWYLCEWKGSLAEIVNTVTGKSYLDTLETKYEQ